jgi:hypothetical protein
MPDAQATPPTQELPIPADRAPGRGCAARPRASRRSRPRFAPTAS